MTNLAGAFLVVFTLAVTALTVIGVVWSFGDFLTRVLAL